MKKKYIWIVEGCWRYEGGEYLKAFFNNKDAKDYKEEWEAKLEKQNYEDGYANYDYISLGKIEIV